MMEGKDSETIVASRKYGIPSPWWRYNYKVLFECIHSTPIHTIGTPIVLGKARVEGKKFDRPEVAPHSAFALFSF